MNEMWKKALGRTLPVAAVLLAVLLVGGVVSGCGSSSSSSSSSATEFEPATAEGETGGEQGGGSSAAVAEAEKIVEEGSAHDVTIDIPTEGPKVESGKSIACILAEASNPTVSAWCEKLKEIGQKFGWTTTNYDGQGTPDGERKAILSAAATKPSVMILGSTKPEAVTSTLEEAADQGIEIIGMNVSTEPGKVPNTPIFWNVQADADDWAALTAAMIVANSGGTGEAIQISDETYPIARAQTSAFEEVFPGSCTECNYLGYKNVPTSTAAKEMPTLMSSWIQEYTEPFYVVAQNDGLWFDTIGSGLNGVPPTGRVMFVGKDGSPAAIERIRNEEFEVASVVSPNALQAYIAFDEANRALHGEAPSEASPPYHLITKDNVEEEFPNGEEVWTPVWTGYEEAYEELWKTGKRK